MKPEYDRSLAKDGSIIAKPYRRRDILPNARTDKNRPAFKRDAVLMASATSLVWDLALLIRLISLSMATLDISQTSCLLKDLDVARCLQAGRQIFLKRHLVKDRIFISRRQDKPDTANGLLIILSFDQAMQRSFIEVVLFNAFSDIDRLKTQFFAINSMS